MIWFIGVAIIVFYLILSSEVNSQKALDVHNHKVSLDSMLKDAYKNSSTKELEKKLVSIEKRYIEVVDNGYSLYKSKYKRNTNDTGLFLNFEKVFSLEEYEVIAMYEAIYEIINRRKKDVKNGKSYYKKIKSQLEYEYGITGLDY